MVKKLDAAQYYSKGSEQPNSLRKYELLHLVRAFIKSDQHIALDLGELLIAYELKTCCLVVACHYYFIKDKKTVWRINCCHDQEKVRR